MTSNNHAAADTSRNRETRSSSPLERHTTSSTFSSSKNRYSLASSDTAESSTSATQQNNLLNDTIPVVVSSGGNTVELNAESTGRDDRGGHKSHRSRNSGGFLLSDASFEPPMENATQGLPRQRSSVNDYRGKAAVRSPEKKHKPRRSNVGPGLGSSPLAGNVTTADATGIKALGQSTADKIVIADHATGAKSVVGKLDVDSAQIVNLALNLSESRRNASRRILSSPLPPPAPGLGESMAGGSLRYHLNQQRRTSRNVSPKPDRGEGAFKSSSRVPSGQRINSPLQAAFDTELGGGYQYRFSTSTLARAEKAKNAIELIAQYRRLLQYVPPLKPQALERTSTASAVGTDPGSPMTLSNISPFRTPSKTEPRPLGRDYNPLQYIRNRKVRARNSKAIDGEQEGYGDLKRVRPWVDEVSREASSEEYQMADCLPLPPFSKVADPTSHHTSPQSIIGRSNTSVKIKRPRVDWMTNPADMLADVYWLEQDDNKKMIEDHHGQRIFPRGVGLKRPVSRRGEDSEPPRTVSPVIKEENLKVDLRIDTKLPEFKSVRSEPERFPDVAASRARQKLREVRHAARIHHGHNGSAREARQFLRAKSRSDSDSSDSDTDRSPSMRRRSGTAGSHDRGKDILEKQMAEMIAKESTGGDWSTTHDIEGQRIIHSIEAQKPQLKEDLEKSQNGSAGHSRSTSLVNKDNRSKRDSLRNASSGRASLDVPRGHPQGSLEDLDTTAPNSPQIKAKANTVFIPSIGMDLTSPRSRHTSRSRPLSRVRSKIRERVHHSSHTEDEAAAQAGSKEQASDSPDTAEKRKRSMSPAKNINFRKADERMKPLKMTSSLRKGKGEDSSGIRSFLKSARHPVARVSGLLWKKESSPGYGTSSGVSTDDEDIEDTRASNDKAEKHSSRESSAAGGFEDLDKAWLRKERFSYLSEMPNFTSPSERRGRPFRTRSDEATSHHQSITVLQEAREKRRQSARAQLQDPTPRIDVHSPASSPDLDLSDRARRNSSISDLDLRRGSFPNGVQRADSRLNAILGIPNKRGNFDEVTVTSLASLKPSRHGSKPSLERKRQWSISDRGVSVHRGPMTKREIARVRALLLSSGIKANEISRRAEELKDLSKGEAAYSDIAVLAPEDLTLVPKSQQHILAARILSKDIQLSSRMWQESADKFCNATISSLLSNIETLQSRLVDNLTPMARKAGDEADEVSKDLVTSQTLMVKTIGDTMDKMLRRRRRRFRWLRRGGWVLVEWALVGVMWYVWFMVMLARIVMGVGHGIVGSLRWLFFV